MTLQNTQRKNIVDGIDVPRLLEDLANGEASFTTPRQEKLTQAIEILGDSDPLISRLVGELHTELAETAEKYAKAVAAHLEFPLILQGIAYQASEHASERILSITLTIDGNPDSEPEWRFAWRNSESPTPSTSTSTSTSTSRRTRPVVNGREYSSPRAACEALGLEPIIQKSQGRLVRRWADTLQKYCNENGLTLIWQ